MELVYVWIKQYQSIRNQGFHFGGRLLCEYDSEAERLTVRDNPHFFAGFFELRHVPEPRAEIVNVTAIVGENGAGKSSLLRFIQELARGSWRGRLIEAVVVYRETDGKICAYHHENCPVHIDNYTSHEAVPRPLKELDFSEAVHVYYSNVFDQYQEERNYSSSLLNISTNYLVEEDSSFGLTARRYSAENHRVRETERQVRFLSSPDAALVKKAFQLPEQLSISVSEVDAEPMYKEMHRDPLTTFFKALVTELRYETITKEQVQNGHGDKLWLMKKLMIRCAEQLFLEMGRLNLKKTVYEQSRGFLKMSIKGVQNRFMAFLANLERSLRSQNFPSYAIEFVQGMSETLYFFDRNIWNGRLAVDNNSVVLSLEEDVVWFQELLRKYPKTAGAAPILEFEWRDLSSGEKALLKLYSRFYSIVEKEHGHSKLTEHATVLLDEGELYFHPQWQKRLFMDLLTFLPGLLGRHGVRSLQLILTSNSPFFVSDLPSSHLVFLQKQDGAGVVVERLDDQHQTFAANIHSLLAHSFFMKNGILGEFAKQKINQTIDLLINGSKADIQRQRPAIEYLIGITGEPVLRHKLIGLLEERLSIAFFDLEDRVQALERELEALKGRRSE